MGFLQHESCPKCGSDDNLARYEDGGAKCFTPGCGYYEKAEGQKPKSVKPRKPVPFIEQPADAFEKPITSRNIDAKTMRRFGYFPAKYKGAIVHVAPLYNDRGEVAGQEVRVVETKEFFCTVAEEGFKPVHGWLFGRNVWGDGSHKKVQSSAFRSRILIVEGALDCMTVAKITGFKLPVVSVINGAGSAKKHIASNIEWLEKFDEILLGLDNDEPGREALEECAPLFSLGKVKVVTWTGGKDPNAMDMAGRPGDVTLSIESASAWAPSGTITGDGLLTLLEEEEKEEIAPPLTFPWAKMQKACEGAFRQHDAILFLAGSGIGKSTFFFECIPHWIKEGHKVATVFLEDRPTQVLNGLLTVASDHRLRLNPKELSSKQKKALVTQNAWQDALFIEDPIALLKTKDSLYSKIRYLVGARGITIVIIDPLSFLVAKSVTDHDERRGIDHLMTELSDMARVLRVSIIMSHHLSRPQGDMGHEEGAAVSVKHARGSHGVGMFSANILAIEAPNKAKGEAARKVKILKSRWRGELAGEYVTYLQMDNDTGRLIEVPPKFDQDADFDDAPPSFGASDDF